MLINRIKGAYWGMIRRVDTELSIVTVPITQPAANASDFSQSEIQARSLRRQSRLNRQERLASVGWSVRTW